MNQSESLLDRIYVRPVGAYAYEHDTLGGILGPSVTVLITPRNGQPFLVSMPVALASILYVDTENIAAIRIFHGSLIDSWGGSV